MIFNCIMFSVKCYFLFFFRFQMQYGVRAQTALPYAMNSEFSRVMATQMVNLT